MTLSSKTDALDALERARADYIAAARRVASDLAPNIGDTITVDQVRAVLPPPDCIDGRVMGAILRKPTWEVKSYGGGARKTSHQRPIARFVRVAAGED